MTGLRTIYNGPVYDEGRSVRADEVRLGDFIFGRVLGRAVYGVVDRITTGPGGRVRLGLRDETDGAFGGEATFEAGERFHARRLKSINNRETR